MRHQERGRLAEAREGFDQREVMFPLPPSVPLKRAREELPIQQTQMEGNGAKQRSRLHQHQHEHELKHELEREHQHQHQHQLRQHQHQHQQQHQHQHQQQRQQQHQQHQQQQHQQQHQQQPQQHLHEHPQGPIRQGSLDRGLDELGQAQELRDGHQDDLRIHHQELQLGPNHQNQLRQPVQHAPKSDSPFSVSLEPQDQDQQSITAKRRLSDPAGDFGFLGSIPADPVSAFDVLHNPVMPYPGQTQQQANRMKEPHQVLQGQGFGNDDLIMTTQDHCLVTAQRLEGMARRDEFCDLEVIFLGSSPSQCKMASLHCAHACASSPVLRNLLLSQTSRRGGLGKTTEPIVRRSSPSLLCEMDSSTSTTGGNVPPSANGGPKGNGPKGASDAWLNTGEAHSSFQERVTVKHVNVRNGIMRTSIVVPEDASFDFDTFSSVRSYMYTGILRFSQHNVFKLLICAIELEIQSLVDLTSDFIVLNVCDSNVFDVLGVAHDRQLLNLEKAGLEFFIRNFDCLTELPGWPLLDAGIVRSICRSDKLKTKSEGNVFRALLRWIEGDKKNRTETFLDMVCSDVRISNMTRPELIELSQHALCASSKAVRLALYNEALARQGDKSAKSEGQRPRDYGPRQVYNGPIVRTSSNEAPVVALDSLACERTITVHEHAICALTVFENFVITASGDGMLRVFDADSWDCVRVLEGHTNSVVSVTTCGGYIISASPDKTLRVWCPRTWTTVHVVNTGKSATCSMCVIQDKLITGSDDGLLKSWNTAGWSLLRTVPAHQHVVWSLACYNKDTLVSASSDTTIRVWSLSRNEFDLVTSLTVHNDEVQGLAVDQKRHWLFAGSDDGVISIHDCKTWTCIRTITCHGKAVLSLLTYGNKLVSGMGNGSIFVWDKDQILNREDCFASLIEHKSCVMALSVARGKLVSASYDRTVKVWGPN